MSDYLNKLASDAGYQNYAAYLKSNHWRENIKKFGKSRCFCCGHNRKLQLHHTDYARLGCEISTDLVTLCNSCHGIIHKIVKEKEVSLADAHWVQKKRMNKIRNDRKWVGCWKRLQNKSKKQTISELFAFLLEKQLIDKDTEHPTKKSLSLGYAKKGEKGQFLWSIPKHIELRRAVNKLQKYKKSGKKINYMLKKRALER